MASKRKTLAELRAELLASYAIGAGPYCPYCRNARKAQLADPRGFDIGDHVTECIKKFENAA